MVKVTVLGAGNAGFTLAFHLAHMGHQVALFEHPDFKQAIEPVQKADNVIVAVEEEGGFKAVVHGSAKMELVTSDIQAAVQFGDVVIIIVPAFGQVPIFEMALPHLKDGQIFISMPGNFASLAYAKTMAAKGVTDKKLFFVDTDSIPYACRKLTENKTFMSGIKKQLNTGVYPAEATEKVLDICQPLFSLKLIRLKNVIEAGFCNMNMIVHPPPVIFNAGWIEATKGNFSFYTDGCSPAVCKVMDAIDNERMEIAAALGLKTENFMTIDKGWYGDTGKDNTYEHIHFGAFHGFFPGPPNLANRYIAEDMCFILVPIVRLLAGRYNIPTPMCDAMFLMCETLTGQKLVCKRDFEHVVKEGENVEQMHQRLAKWM